MNTVIYFSLVSSIDRCALLSETVIISKRSTHPTATQSSVGQQPREKI